jgi:hypothetical protein
MIKDQLKQKPFIVLNISNNTEIKILASNKIDIAEL